MYRIILVFALIAACVASALGADANPRAEDEATIRKAVESYVSAFNQGDAKALAALWSPEAVYTNPDSGEQAVGREAIETQFTGVFAARQGAKLEAETEAIEFVSPNVAVERGKAAIVRADQAREESAYTAVYIKQGGAWLLDRVTEEDLPVVPSHYEQLKELDWMVGNWIDQDQQSRIETSCMWAKNQSFLLRFFSLEVRDRIEMSGVQVVGWDPTAGKIRSWVFDSDGGFGGGVWSKQGDAWHIQSTGQLPDGTSSSSVNILTYVDENTFTWQSVNRQVGGELLPNVDEVVVVRQTSAE